MIDFPRLVDGAGNDPAALLLRSARTDTASQVSKDRVRAMLGLAEQANEPDAQPARLPALPERMPKERAKRTRKIEPFIPFQHLISPAKSSSTRKFGSAAVVFVQVAAMVAALFVHPVSRMDSVKPAAPSRGDEPEVSFFVPKVQPRESTGAQAKASDGPAKPVATRKEGMGTAGQSRGAGKRVSMPLEESIVGDEHAGALAENEQPPVVPSTLAREVPETSPAWANAPMIFQAGMAQPVRIAGTDPSYPQIARLRGVKGTVIMRCLLTEKGLAQNCVILKSPAYLDDAVLSASHTWRFTPMTWQGRVVPVHYVFKYNFKLG